MDLAGNRDPGRRGVSHQEVSSRKSYARGSRGAVCRSQGRLIATLTTIAKKMNATDRRNITSLPEIPRVGREMSVGMLIAIWPPGRAQSN